MGLGHSPQIVTNGMVLCLDAANPKNFNLTEVEVLVVAGGGGGGGRSGGGGGAGGLIYNRNFAVTPGSALTVTVGGGGNGGDGSGSPGSDGGNSIFGSLTAIGGGGGGSDGGDAGRTGGSGGGGRYGSSGGTGTSGQGFAGGSGTSGTWKAGGGGGAGGVGVNGVSNPHKCGDGGSGLGFDISGTFTYYAGGGGGGSHNSDAGGCCDDVTARGLGGIGGGGNGGTPGGYNAGDNATTNTGGGGGGYYQYGPGGAAGGSGIVIVRYPGPQKAIGGTVTSVAGHTIHTFTTVGSTTFTPLVATNNSAILGLSDFSGNGNFGTTANSPTYSSANGGSVSFDGTDEHILGTIQSSIFSGPHSICCWFYRETVKEWSGLFSNNVNTTSCSILTFISTTNALGTNQAGVNGTSISVDLGADHLNKWIYAAITYAGVTSGSSVNVYAYKNGSLLTASGSLYWNMSSSSSYYIGRHWASGMQVHDGFISQVQLYNRALSAAEIQQNFTATRARFGI